MAEHTSEQNGDESTERADAKYLNIVSDAPTNWGKWGHNDEIGAVQYLDEAAVLRGTSAITSGRTFTLGAPIGHPDGDPAWPTRSGADHHMLREKGHFDAGKVSRAPYGGWENSDDLLYIYNHGTTHVDALGHVWYDDKLYNGFDAQSTNAGLEHCGIEHVAARGITGRGILLDIARYRDVEYLSSGERITVEELESCAAEQEVSLEKRDIILIRTGAMDLFYDEGPDAFYDEFSATHGGEPILNEAGLTYTKSTAEWFKTMEIPLLATDTVTAEQTVSETTDTRLPLHPVLLRDLGILISEMNCLGELAQDCANDGQYEFLYVGGPLHVSQGSGAPINPVAIK